MEVQQMKAQAKEERARKLVIPTEKQRASSITPVVTGRAG